MNYSKHTPIQLQNALRFARIRVDNKTAELAHETAVAAAIEAQQAFNQSKTMTHSEIEIALGHKVKIA